MLHKIISIVQVITSFALIILIMIQQKGGGLSGFLGGASGGNYMKKRGMEKTLHVFTILFMFLFILSSILIFIVK